MESARVEVAREAAGVLPIGGSLEGLHEVGLAARDGGAARLARGHFTRRGVAAPVRLPPRRLDQRADARGDLF